MDNASLAGAFEEIATLKELQGEDGFRSQAYRNTARRLETLTQDAAELVRTGTIKDQISSLGKSQLEVLGQLVSQGSSDLLNDLRARTPPGHLQMLKIAGIGPKKVRALFQELGVTTLPELASACETGKVAALKGGVRSIAGQGETKASVVLEAESSTGRLSLGGRLTINADLRVVSPSQFPFALNYFTGSKEHNVLLRQRAQARGWRLNEYELEGHTEICTDEADIYKALGLAYVEPEMREGTGEDSAAEAGKLPSLVKSSDIRGVFHNHTTASDGADTLEAMALAARELGLEYLGIGDHSQSLTVANGLTPDRVRQQWNEIDALNARLKGITLLKGTECDILPDGSLDFDDALLAGFDYVVASVHTHFGQTREEMTERICRALEHPMVTMLGHATGRLLLRRDAYAVDLEAVMKTAARTGTMIEINANPMRLDLDWVHCRRARELGVLLVINPDAHSREELAYFTHGVDVARRAWLTAAEVYNTKSVQEVLADLALRRKQQPV
ncbi:MAG: PHP domain-containing protein [Planctomycetota bacterium]|nr:PHP domain-containing protein [Planctomycetota bacterium]